MSAHNIVITKLVTKPSSMLVVGCTKESDSINKGKMRHASPGRRWMLVSLA